MMSNDEILKQAQEHKLKIYQDLHPDKIWALQNQVIKVYGDGRGETLYVSDIIDDLKGLSKKHKVALHDLKAKKDDKIIQDLINDLAEVSEKLQFLEDYNSMINHMSKKDYSKYLEYLDNEYLANLAEEAKHVRTCPIY